MPLVPLPALSSDDHLEPDSPNEASSEAQAQTAIDDLAHLLARIAGLRRAVAWDAESFELPDLHEASALVQKCQPMDPPSLPVSQQALDALAAWAALHGVRFAPGLRLLATPKGASVKATAPIARGATLVEVPLSAMLRNGDVFADPILGPWLQEAPLFGPGNLMLWLLRARYVNEATNTWAPYVAALPGEVAGTALSWPRSPGSHLVAANMGRSFLAGVLQLYCIAHHRLRLTEPAKRPLPLEAFTLQRWLWAGAILSSRQTAVPDELALVPLWDLLDHDETLGAESTFLEGNSLRAVAGMNYTAGEAVRMFYGRRTPTERWVYAGFVVPGPPDGERAKLAFPLPKDAPLRRDKLVWLLADPERAIEVTVAHGDVSEALKRARWYALDADELDRLGIASVADVWREELQLSVSGEARARGMLADWLAFRAGPVGALDIIDTFSPEHEHMLRAAHAHYSAIQRSCEASG
ncbi:MAG: hypothetical protein SFV15_06600 [Polyangiaceae bacterium]|nr:hypothetical protein [Polyangiaceae bacterium]